MEDPVESVVSVLDTDWTKANTGDFKPIISAIYSIKRGDLTNRDYVLMYAVDHAEKPVSLGYTHIDYTDTVNIDIRTKESKTRLNNLRDEVRRIVYANRKDFDGYKIAKVNSIKDLSDKMNQMYRYVITIELWKVYTTVPT